MDQIRRLLTNPFVALLLGVFAPSDTHALSCIYIPAEVAISNAVTAEYQTMAVRGKIEFQPEFQPTRGHLSARIFPNKVWHGLAIVEGVNIATDQKFEARISTIRSCVSVWCGSANSNDQALIVMTPDAKGELKIYLSPCGGSLFKSPEQDVINSIKQCLTTGECE